MTKMVIEKGEVEEWSNNKLIEYASRSVPNPKVPGTNKRLVFGLFVAGGYKVTLGNETLYEGGSFSGAQAAFHDAQPN